MPHSRKNPITVVVNNYLRNFYLTHNKLYIFDLSLNFLQSDIWFFTVAAAILAFVDKNEPYVSLRYLDELTDTSFMGIRLVVQGFIREQRNKHTYID